MRVIKYSNITKSNHNYTNSYMPALNPTISKYLLTDYTFLQDYLILPHALPSPPSSTANPNTITNNINNNTQQFLAEIIGTTQQVLFTKILYNQMYVNRFEALAQLYEQGVVLLDNIFVLQEGQKYYFYIVEAYIGGDGSDLGEVSLGIMEDRGQFGNDGLVLEDNQKQYCKNNLSQNISELSQIHAHNNNNHNNSKSPRYTTLHNLINSPNFASTSLSYKFRIIQQIKILLECCHQSGQPFIQLTPHHILIDLEQQQSVYFSPFKLDVQLVGGGGDARELVAYVAPEILEIGMRMENKQEKQTKNNFKSNKNTAKNNGELVVNSEDMIKADIWSFGCIILEILLYCSPIFYAVNNHNQLAIIKLFTASSSLTLALASTQNSSFNLQNCIKQIRQLIKPTINKNTNTDMKQFSLSQKLQLIINLLQNCLQINPKYRMLTTQRIITNSDIQKQNKKYDFQQNIKKDINDKNEIKIVQLTNTIQNQQQIVTNHNSNTSDSDSELILTFIQVSGIQIKKQLRIDIFVDRKYSIFVTSNTNINTNTNKIVDADYNQQLKYNSNSTYIHDKHKHSINKTIKIKCKYQKLRQILQKPLKIQCRQQNNINSIYVSIEILTLQNNGKRVWDKPIIASYANTDGAIVKIRSQLVCQIDQYRYEEKRVIKEIERVVKERGLVRKIGKVQKGKQNLINTGDNQQISLIPLSKLAGTNILQKQFQNKNKTNLHKTILQQKQQPQYELQHKSLTTVSQPQSKLQSKSTLLPQLIPKVKQPSPSYGDSFNKINQNLQQICSKWKSKFKSVINSNSNYKQKLKLQVQKVMQQRQIYETFIQQKQLQQMTPISKKIQNNNNLSKSNNISQFSNNNNNDNNNNNKNNNNNHNKPSTQLQNQYHSLQCSRQNRQKVRDEQIRNKIQQIKSKLKIK